MNELTRMKRFFYGYFMLVSTTGIIRNNCFAGRIRQANSVKKAQTDDLNGNGNTQIFLQYPIDRAHVQCLKDNE